MTPRAASLGQFTVWLTDKPQPGIDEVDLLIDRVDVVFTPLGSTQEQIIPVRSEVFDIDLLKLQGAQRVIAEGSLPDGEIAEIRLILRGAHLIVGGQWTALQTPSAMQSGLKLIPDAPLDVRAGVPANILFDFNAAQSIVQQGNGDYLLKPVISVVPTNSVPIADVPPDVPRPIVVPPVITAGANSDVTIVVELANPNVDTTTAHLQMKLPDGTTRDLGPLLDDGMGADETAGDLFFTLQTTLMMPMAGTIQFQLTAKSVNGTALSSAPATLEVDPPGEPTSFRPADTSLAVDDQVSGGQIMPNEFIAFFVSGVTWTDVQQVAAAAGGKVVGRIPEIGAWQISVPGDGTADGLYLSMLPIVSDPRLDVVVPEVMMTGQFVDANDTKYQWPTLDDHRIKEAWALSLGGHPRVAVLDSGFDNHNPDLNRIETGPNVSFSGGVDCTGHGTACNGIIGATTDNGVEIAGVTWYTPVMSIKTADCHIGMSGFTNPASAAAGMFAAVDRNAKVLSMSFGHNGFSQQLQSQSFASFFHRIGKELTRFGHNVEDFFVQKVILGFLERKSISVLQLFGAMCVGSAGNDGMFVTDYPAAACDFAAAATEPENAPMAGKPKLTEDVSVNLADFSNYGTDVNLAANGDFIEATWPMTLSNGVGTTEFSGTSAAAPIIAGIVSLYWSQHRSASPRQVRRALAIGAFDGGAGVNSANGSTPMPFRRVNAVESFNVHYGASGLWHDQGHPEGIAVSSQIAPALVTITGTNLPSTVTAGQSAWWFGSSGNGTYVDPVFDPNPPRPAPRVVPPPPVTVATPPIDIVQKGTNAEIGGLDYVSLKYNKTTDSFLTINQEGFDRITEIKRDGTFTDISTGFGLGGLQMDNLTISDTNTAYVSEGHSGTIYEITPASAGGTRMTIADDLNPLRPNPVFPLITTDVNNDVIARFAQTWYRLSPTGQQLFFNYAFGFDEVSIARHPVTKEVYVTDQGRIEQLNTQNGFVPFVFHTTVMSTGFTGAHLEIEPNTNVFYAVDPDTGVGPVGGTDVWAFDPNGNQSTTVYSAPSGQHVFGIAFAPGSADKTKESLYALQSDIAGQNTNQAVTVRLVEILGSFSTNIFTGGGTQVVTQDGGVRPPPPPPPPPPPATGPHSGGTSVAVQSGVLSTPPITFVNQPGPAITFMTWYEIESMDPAHYDIMEVRARDLITNQSVLLTTLNPTSDPSGRPDLPYVSGGGFNGTPQWTRVGPLAVPIDEFGWDPTTNPVTIGHPFVIEFSFDTRDRLYNGFRGWLVDDIRLDPTPTAIPPERTPHPFTPR